MKSRYWHSSGNQFIDSQIWPCFSVQWKNKPASWSGQSGTQQIEIFLYFIYRLYWWKLLVLTLLTKYQLVKPAQKQKLDHLRRALVSTPLINWRKGSKRVGFMRRWLCRTSAITADTSWGECLPGCRGVYGSVMSQREIINIQILQTDLHTFP